MTLPALMPDFEVPGLPFDWVPPEDFDGAPLPYWLQPEVLFEHWKGGLYIVDLIVPMHERRKMIVVYKQVKSGEFSARDVEDFLADMGEDTFTPEHGHRAKLRFAPVRYAPDLVGAP